WIVKRKRVRTIGELCQYCVLELLESASFGETSLRELHDQLGARGLRLRDDKAGPCVVPQKRPRFAPRDWSTVPLAEVDLSPLTLYFLERRNVTTVADLSRLTARGLRSLAHYQAVHEELLDVLSACGLRPRD